VPLSGAQIQTNSSYSVAGTYIQKSAAARFPRNVKHNGGSTMRRHSHKFTIADDEAVRALLEKLVGGKGPNQARRDKLLRALDDASRHYKDSDQKVRRAFFHGLLTGYAVALKLC
jgi:hypothetical protein